MISFTLVTVAAPAQTTKDFPVRPATLRPIQHHHAGEVSTCAHSLCRQFRCLLFLFTVFSYLILMHDFYTLPAPICQAGGIGHKARKLSWVHKRSSLTLLQEDLYLRYYAQV